MNNKKDKILVYKVEPDEFAGITYIYGKRYEVIDESSCFTDILTIPAKVIFLNPDALTEEEYSQLNEVFQWDADTHLVFTAIPKNESPIKYLYCVEDDLADLTGRTRMVDELLQIEDEYTSAVQLKIQMLSDIEDLFAQAEEESSTISKTVGIQNLCLLYRHFTDIIQYMKNGVEHRERVAFRYEIINILLSMKLAYGLIDVADVTPFDYETSEDSNWIISLAEIIKSHREEYLTHGNHLYVPREN